MAKIILRGKLGKVFKSEWILDVKTPKEAFRALEVNTNGKFSKYIKESQGNNLGYKLVIDGYKIIDEADICLFNKILDNNSTIEMIPVVGGSGTEGFWVQLLIQLLIAVAVTVASMLLAPSPKTKNGSNDAKKESFLFTGQGSTTKQGYPVPVGYGRMMVPPKLISVEYVYNNALKGAGGNILPGSSYEDYGADFDDEDDVL